MKEQIIRLARKIVADKDAMAMYASGAGLHHLCAWRLEQAAGNHAFDDHPEAFGISEEEGHEIRAFFQTMPFIELERVKFRKQVDDWIDEAIEPFCHRLEIAEKASIKPLDINS